jgi:hypothetical protein
MDRGRPLLIVLWMAVRTRQSRHSGAHADPQVYFGLRDLMLKGSREKFGIAAPSKPTEPWGVLMDWGIPAGSATVVALVDGSASVYLSSGGGFLGGGQSHESIRGAAKQAVEAAKEVQPLMHPSADYPLPQRGQVTFYLLTDSGVFGAGASEDDLKSHRSPLYKLGDAAQKVITEYGHIQ